ncbi:MAG: DUF6364 family protein [Mariprofundaceae bacterium]|nr:DUF6364 family protein [Mariprofundaceae bacterium]
MATKLTLSLDEQTIEQAKIWAKQHQTSLSALVEGYFESLISKSQGTTPSSLAPKTSSLSGMFKAYDEGLSYKELIHKHKGEQ